MPGLLRPDLWSIMLSRTAALRKQICNHSFNRKLAEDTLPFPVFMSYVPEDLRYLEHGMAPALRNLARRSTLETHITLFAQVATDTIQYEQDVRKKYLDTKQTHPASFFHHRVTLPAVDAYIEHLLDTTENAPVAAGVAAILGCFYSYHETWQPIAPPDASHGYRDWILTCQDEAFTQTVFALQDCAVQLFDTPHPADTESCIFEAFETSLELEHAFFDAVIPTEPAYRLRYGNPI